MSIAARGVLLSVHLKENHTKVRLRTLEGWRVSLHSPSWVCTETRELLEGARRTISFLIIYFVPRESNQNKITLVARPRLSFASVSL